MPDILKELPIVDILNTGLAGFCFLVALFGYLLLRSEQGKDAPRVEILAGIESFTKKTLLFALIVAGASFAAVAGRSIQGDDEKLNAHLASLPEAVRSSDPEDVRNRIRQTLDQLEDLKLLPALGEKINGLETRLEALQRQNQMLSDEKDEFARQLAALDGNFLVKIARLNIRLNEFGGSINPYYPFDEIKREVNRQIQDLLAELDYCTVDPDGDREKTRADLIAYQKAKGFSTVGFFALPTVRCMIVDYLSHGFESETKSAGDVVVERGGGGKG